MVAVVRKLWRYHAGNDPVMGDSALLSVQGVRVFAEQAPNSRYTLISTNNNIKVAMYKSSTLFGTCQKFYVTLRPFVYSIVSATTRYCYSNYHRWSDASTKGPCP